MSELEDKEKKKKLDKEKLALKKKKTGTDVAIPKTTSQNAIAGGAAANDAGADGGGALGGAATGALSGAAVGGVPGAIVGGVLGGAKGLMGKKKAKAERESAAKLEQAKIFQKQGQDEALILQNLMNSLRQTILF